MATLKALSQPLDMLGDVGITAAQLQTQRASLRTSLARLDAIKTNCGACEHFSMGRCGVHGDVPEEFQKVEGQCEDWRYDGIPF